MGASPLRVGLCCVVALCAGTGCVYWPHQQQRSPELQGVLLRQGAPAANVPVRLWINPPRDSMGRCSGSLRAQTDEAGRFVVPRVEERDSFIIMGDRRDVWQLCFLLPDEEKVTWFGSGWWGGPKVQRLACEVGAAQPGRVRALPVPVDAQGLGCRELPEPADGK
ncbi:MAG TPA: hypothetical protein VGK67_34450 [Myxococcales bacterium]|jgi:hypothetical protein